MLASVQTQPVASQNPAHLNATEKLAEHNAKPETKHATSRSVPKIATRKRAKRPEYRSASTKMPVDVIIGNTKRRVMFDRLQPSGAQTPSGQLKVEVINGASTDMQYFDNGQEQTVARNQTVVIGIQSSDTRFAGGNKHTVVTAVNSGGPTDAKTESSGGEPVTKSISPRPKRPIYQPDLH